MGLNANLLKASLYTHNFNIGIAHKFDSRISEPRPNVENSKARFQTKEGAEIMFMS